MVKNYNKNGDSEKLQALRNLLGETPVNGTVTKPYIKLSVSLATDIITQLNSAIRALEGEIN